MKKKWRTIQPPHPSEKFTLEEAMEAWRKVEGKAAERAASPRSRSVSQRPQQTTQSRRSPLTDRPADAEPNPEKL
jgi:hypothetical protein